MPNNIANGINSVENIKKNKNPNCLPKRLQKESLKYSENLQQSWKVLQ